MKKVWNTCLCFVFPSSFFFWSSGMVWSGACMRTVSSRRGWQAAGCHQKVERLLDRSGMGAATDQTAKRDRLRRAWAPKAAAVASCWPATLHGAGAREKPPGSRAGGPGVPCVHAAEAEGGRRLQCACEAQASRRWLGCVWRRSLLTRRDCGCPVGCTRVTGTAGLDWGSSHPSTGNWAGLFESVQVQLENKSPKYDPA
jgi:hypothetical protein